MDKQTKIPLCPKCNAKMILRTNRRNGRKFWGCSRYSKGCRGTRQYKQPEIKKDLLDLSQVVLSEYQRAGLDAFLDPNVKHMMFEATAGSGKTFELQVLLQHTSPDSKIAFLVFNKRNAVENQAKVPDHVQCSTISALGLKNVLRSLPEVSSKNIDTHKLHKMLDQYYAELEEEHGEEAVVPLKSVKGAVITLVDSLKANLYKPSEDNLAKLKEKHQLEWILQDKWVFQFVGWLYYESLKNLSMIDFSDMITLCVEDKRVSCEKFDVLLVDEAQDMSPAFIQFILNSVKPEGKIVAVGDQYQSIYAFRDADSKAMSNIQKALDAKVLPLSMTYRNSKAVVKYVNERFPHIIHEAKENAPEGEVKSIQESEFAKMVKEGDMVICRNNAPLVSPALELLSKGIKAVIMGKQIGKDLEDIIGKVIKRFHADDIADLLAGLEEYEIQETEKLRKMKYNSSADLMSDKIQAIVAMTDGLKSIDALLDRIATIFSETTEGVTFSSIHKAKGLEAETVFILKPELMPSPHAVTEEDIQQEENCEFVAISRPKLNLYFVRENN